MKIALRRVIGTGLIGCGFALMAAGPLYYWLSPRIYQSTTRIAVEKVISDIQSGSSVRTEEAFDPYWITTEWEQIKAKVVLFPVIENLGLHKRWNSRFPREELSVENAYFILRNQLQIRQPRGSSDFEIQVSSADRMEAAEIANEIARIYGENRLELRRQFISRGIQTLEKAWGEREQTLRESESLVDRLREELNIPETAITRADVEGEVQELHRPYYDARAALETQTRIRAALELRIAQEKADLETISSPVTIIERAEPASRPVSPRPVIAMACFASGLLLLAVGISLLRRRECLGTSSTQGEIDVQPPRR